MNKQILMNKQCTPNNPHPHVGNIRTKHCSLRRKYYVGSAFLFVFKTALSTRYTLMIAMMYPHNRGDKVLSDNDTELRLISQLGINSRVYP